MTGRPMPRSRRIPARPEPRIGTHRPRGQARPTGTAPASRGRLGPLLRRILGLRRRIRVGGVVYHETRPLPLERAIASPRHGGKRFDVVFPDGRTMSITATATRRFADLMDVPEVRSLGRAEDLARPGQRVLILGGGTGALAALVASWVGPHGAIVSVEHDGESVRFARRRYTLPSVSVERGGAESLAGEVNESFDLVIVVAAWVAGAGRRESALAEAWRVTRRGGRLIAIDDAATDPSWLGFDPGPVQASRRAPADAGPSMLVLARPEAARPVAGHEG